MTGVTPITGLVWGFVGTLAMVVVMRIAGGDAPPPFAVFWDRFVGGTGDPSDAMPQALLAHVGYGSVAGAVYAVAFNQFDLGYSIVEYTGSVLWGIAWAIVLFVVGAVVWVNLVLEMDPGREQVLSMGAAHLAYGVVVGVLGAAVPHLL